MSNVDALTVAEDDVVGPTVFARRVAWPAPPVVGPDLGDNSHCHGLPGCGENHGPDGHMDGHGDAHAADAHGHAANGHGHGAGGHFLLRLGGAVADRLFGTPLHDKFCGGGGNDVISLDGGPDVGYGGDCGPLEPPMVTKSGWWRTLPALWRHAGDVDAAPKSGPGVNDNDRLTGGKGDDALFGGTGADRLVGGSGPTTCPAAAATTGWSAVRGGTASRQGAEATRSTLRTACGTSSTAASVTTA